MDPINKSPIASGSQMPPITPEERAQGGPSEPKTAVGPIAGAAIIICLLIAGGLYFWGAKLNQQPSVTPYIPSDSGSAPPQVQMPTSDASAGLPPQSSSDDVSSIQADVSAMSTDQLSAQTATDLKNVK